MSRGLAPHAVRRRMNKETQIILMVQANKRYPPPPL